MTVQPTFVSHKIKQHLKLSKVKPSTVNQQSLVYPFKCNPCDAGYVGYTRQHLHQRIDKQENAPSSIGKHFCVKHSYVPKDLTKNFTTLNKSKNKFDCLIYEMFLLMNGDQVSMYSPTQFVLKFLIIRNYVILACILLFLTPFFTFSYFTYFYFFVLYLYLCKSFYLHF